MAPVAALIHQSAAHVRQGASAQQHIQPPVPLDDLRVPHMVGHVGGEVVVGHQQGLAGEVDAVGAFHPQHVLLPPGVDIVKVAGVPDVAGVIQVQLAVLFQRRPAVDAVPVAGMVRVDGDGLPAVVDKVFGGVVPPHAGGALGGAAGQRAGDIKNVIRIPDLAQAVGVAQRAGQRRQVIAGPPGPRRGCLAVGVGGCDLFAVVCVFHNFLLDTPVPGQQGAVRAVGRSDFIVRRQRRRSSWRSPCRRGRSAPGRRPGR